MEHQPDHARQRPRHLHLARADQRHLAQPDPPRGHRGELGVQVGGAGEDAAHQVVHLQLVALEHLRDQLLGGLEDHVGVVRVDGRCATQGSQSHGAALSTKGVVRAGSALKLPFWGADADRVNEMNGSSVQVAETMVRLELTLSEAGALRAWLLKPAADGSTALDDALVNTAMKRLSGALDRIEAVESVRRELEEAGFPTGDLDDDQVAELGRRIGQVSQRALRY